MYRGWGGWFSAAYMAEHLLVLGMVTVMVILFICLIGDCVSHPVDWVPNMWFLRKCLLNE